MKTYRFFLSGLACLLLLTACAPLHPNDKDGNNVLDFSTNDPHTYSNIQEIRTEHLHLELEVNFNNKTVYGVARHTMGDHNSDTAIFDIKELEIRKVTVGKGKNEVPTDFVIGKSDALLGQSLKVKITSDTKYINIYYQTTEKTEALDWLPPSLTAGKTNPFMYTQGQAILTRSWIPLQDTPMNRITYSADVKVPAELMAVMSASNPQKKNAQGTYHFEMKQKIPAYLIALAVGDMVYTPLGKNCGVYSEKELADQCAYEFVDLPKMISAAENMYGSYRWDQYDIVMLPYSFPFGGMENPRLTFANPTLLAGDRSMVSVIAHELAHSWSGNLVTNATWNDFWLNEGFTVYFENRIMEEIYGKEAADILAIIEYQDLELALNDLENGEHPEDTHLKLHLDHRNPDDGMTDIAYIKGAYFLRTLEKAVGRKKFDAFLTKYFNEYAFETITTEEFVSYLRKELLEPNQVDFDPNEWIYKPGLPENCVKITSPRLERMKDAAQEINMGIDVFKGTFKGVERGDFITQEWKTFIRNLNTNTDPKVLKEIDDHFKFSTEANSDIKSAWFKLAVEAGYREVRPQMAEYLKQVGRRWYIESIYQALHDSKDSDDLRWAKEVFTEAKANYHFVSKSTIEDVLYN
jgi:aminopeptidase N